MEFVMACRRTPAWTYVYTSDALHYRVPDLPEDPSKPHVCVHARVIAHMPSLFRSFVP
jgi:hypothetical protein